MWQELRDYWLPLLLFTAALLLAVALLALVIAMPFLVDRIPFTHAVLDLFAADATVRRSSIAGAIGLIVTAFVFFRPHAVMPGRKKTSTKPPQDTIAGA